MDRSTKEYQEMMVDGLKYSYSSWIVGFVQQLGHKYIEKRRKNLKLCLEVGCGTAEYLNIFEGDSYLGIDLSFEAVAEAKARHPQREFLCGDIKHLPFPDASLDCVISNYVFEHISDLEVLCLEINRVLKPKGKLLVSLPAEGGFAWGIGRRLTSKRYMEKKFKIDYMELIKQEHVNTCSEVINALGRHFSVLNKSYMPFVIPVVHLNAIVGIECEKVNHVRVG